MMQHDASIKPTNDLNKFFGPSLAPLKISVFFSSGETSPFKCLYTDSDQYSSQKEYSLYKIKPLIRALVEYKKMMNEDVSRELWGKEDRENICYIMEWDDHARKVFIFHTTDSLRFDKEKFKKAVKSSKEAMRRVFKKLFYSQEREIAA